MALSDSLIDSEICARHLRSVSVLHGVSWLLLRLCESKTSVSHPARLLLLAGCPNSSWLDDFGNGSGFIAIMMGQLWSCMDYETASLRCSFAHGCLYNSSSTLPRQAQDVLTSSPHLPLDLQMGRKGWISPSCPCPGSWWGTVLVQGDCTQARDAKPSAKAIAGCSVRMP